MNRIGRIGLLVALFSPACASPTTSDVADVPVDGASTEAGDAQSPPHDAPTVARCGPDAERYVTNVGRCFVAAPMPDGGAPPPGRCAARVSGPAATAPANATDADGLVLPNGRRIARASNRLGLSGFPMSMLRIPGTSFIVVSDGGLRVENLRVMDVSGPTPTVVPGGEVAFPRSGAREPALFYGLAYDAVSRVLYASGGGSNRIFAYDLSAAGALTANPGRTIDVGITESFREGTDASGALLSAYPAGLALSEDGSRLFVALQRGHAIGVYDTMTRAVVRVVPLDVGTDVRAYPYVVLSRPGDTRHMYVSLWGARRVIEFDTMTLTVSRSFDVGKNPEEMLFSSDGTTLYVVASDSDSISVIDITLPMPTVRTTYLTGSAMALRGASPVALAWGPMNRLYVVEADENAIDVLETPSLRRVGRIATEWYPTDVEVLADGSVIVTTGKGVGTGPNATPDTVDITVLIQGSIARYPAPDDATLVRGEMDVTRRNAVTSTFNDVDCPIGTAYDFPVPRIGDTMPSTRIRNVVFIIRENKTYDAVLGDYPGTAANPANGDPALTIVPRNRMADTFPNLQSLVRRFANMDNYYSNAEQSIQGHVRTSLGRSTDYTERSWLTTWGRGTRVVPTQAITPIGLPEEGSIFHALDRARVNAQVWGEIVGSPAGSQNVGTRYPGLFYNTAIPDIDKARAFGRNAQGSCDLAAFSYLLLPNDHTYGGSAGRPTVVSMFQDNDEATGYVVDALSHSSYWPQTLIIVVEDDPQDGGDHVDNHRSPAVLISPWVRRGYTSHVHYDESSIHRTIELILGVAPHNSAVANAAPMYDAFTSTPDFAPYDYIPRRECQQINPATGGIGGPESEGMDFSHPDNAPGLSRLIWRITHSGHEPPWRERPIDTDGDGD